MNGKCVSKFDTFHFNFLFTSINNFNTVLTKSAFLLDTADELAVDDAAGVVAGCTAFSTETVDCGADGVVALKSAKRRSRSATASAGLDEVAVVDVVDVDDVASAFGFDIIMVNVH